MSNGERKTQYSLRVRARDLAINVLVFGGVQILLALLFWQTLFRSHPQGFAMGLTLVGFGSWALAFLASPRGRYRRPTMSMTRMAPSSKAPTERPERPATAKLREQLGTAGCGTVLFLSGLLSLALAFVLRVRADMQMGLTWSDIFPTSP